MHCWAIQRDCSAVDCTEGHLGFAHVIARVVHRVGFVILMRIEFDPAGLDVLLQQVHDADYLEFFVNFGEPIFEPEPGCIVGMSSFGVQNRFTLKSSGVLDDPAHLLLQDSSSRRTGPS